MLNGGFYQQNHIIYLIHITEKTWEKGRSKRGSRNVHRRLIQPSTGSDSKSRKSNEKKMYSSKCTDAELNFFLKMTQKNMLLKTREAQSKNTLPFFVNSYESLLTKIFLQTCT